MILTRPWISSPNDPAKAPPCPQLPAVLNHRQMNHPLFRPLILSALLPIVATAAEKEAKPIVAVYDIEGLVSESGQGESSMLGLSVDPARPLTLLDITRSLEKAADDAAVKGVVVDVDGAQLDFSQIQEIRRQLTAIREAGKDVWVYTEHLSNGTALLGSAANHLTLMPEADCSFHGIHSESMYFKGLMDKVGVRADVIHIGDFKSYGETFYRTGPSDQAKQQEEQLIDSVFTQVVDDVAAGRKLDPAKVRTIIDDGALNPAKAVEAGLADHLMHRTDFVKKLRETYGKDAKFDRSYELPDLEGPEITGIMDVFKLMFSESDSAKARKDFVAVVALDGDITEESVAPVRTQILKLAKEEKAKALVLRVNSPGGSALASEVLWEATDEWKATGKPFIVSMGGVAASGGYYVSAGADRIFAEAGTITGSIGVVGMKFVVGEAMDKLGITTHTHPARQERRSHEHDPRILRRGGQDLLGTRWRRFMAPSKNASPMAAARRSRAISNHSPAAGFTAGNKPSRSAWSMKSADFRKPSPTPSSEAKLEKPDIKLLPEPKSGLEGLFATPDKKTDDEIIRASVRPSASSRLQAAHCCAPV